MKQKEIFAKCVKLSRRKKKKGNLSLTSLTYSFFSPLLLNEYHCSIFPKKKKHFFLSFYLAHLKRENKKNYKMANRWGKSIFILFGVAFVFYITHPPSPPIADSNSRASPTISSPSSDKKRHHLEQIIADIDAQLQKKHDPNVESDSPNQNGGEHSILNDDIQTENIPDEQDGDDISTPVDVEAITRSQTPDMNVAVSVLLTSPMKGSFDWRTLDGAFVLKHSVLTKGIVPADGTTLIRMDNVKREVGLPLYRHPHEEQSEISNNETDNVVEEKKKGGLRIRDRLGVVGEEPVTVYRFWLPLAALNAEREALHLSLFDAPSRAGGSGDSVEAVQQSRMKRKNSSKRRQVPPSCRGGAGGGCVLVELRFIALATHELAEQVANAAHTLGFEIWPSKCPLNLARVQRQQFREELMRDGAVGHRELVKLDGLRMHQFDKVLLIDCDVLFHRSFAPLLAHDAAVAWTEGGWVSERINGGFLVFSPKQPLALQHVDEMITLLEGADFQPGTGWEGKGIGWTYGGRTIQGILPHYLFYRSYAHVLAFNKEQLNLHNSSDNAAVPVEGTSTPVHRAVATAHQQLDRCRYNNMVQLERCKATPYENVISNHFTGDCLKPWQICPNMPPHPLCRKFTDAWNNMQREALQTSMSSLPVEVRRKLEKGTGSACTRHSVGLAFR